MIDDLLKSDAEDIYTLIDLAERARGDEAAQLLAEIDSRILAGSPSTMAMKVSGGAWLPYRHLVYLNKKLRQLADRKIKRLMVTMPPRHGKSWTCSRYFPAWYLSHFPDHRVILTSYEADFAAQWGGEVRDVIEQNTELLGISVKASSSARNRWDLVGHRGGMKTAGARGPITGKGADLFVIDDPVKNDEEARSEAIQERNWNWYLTTAHTRLEPDAVVLLVMTRWHEADLGGKLLDEHGEEWEILNLPALAEDDDPIGRAPGEPLCPERFPLEELEKKRTVSGPHVWSALYQQRPSPEGGARFKKESFRYWEPYLGDKPYYRLIAPDRSELVAVDDCSRFSTMDVAGTTKRRSDWTVISTWDVAPLEPTRLILVDRVRVRIELTSHLELIQQVRASLNPRWFGIDSNAIGLSVFQSAVRAGIPVRENDSDRDKYDSSEIASIVTDNGRVYFPRNAVWLDEWEHELLMFPSGAFDDQVDTFSAAAIEFDRRPQPKKKKGKSRRERLIKKTRSSLHPVLGRI